MNKLLLLLWLFLPGCAALEQIIKRAPEIEQIGKTAVDVGTSTSMFQPEIGVWILTAGGLIIATGKMLKLFKEKK